MAPGSRWHCIENIYKIFALIRIFSVVLNRGKNTVIRTLRANGTAIKAILANVPMVIRLSENAVRLPKLGFVKCRISREVKGRILSATVSQNPAGKYFISLCCTDVEVEKLPTSGKTVGLDMGLHDLVISSDGKKYPNHKYLAKNLKKLAKLQRQLSRKSKGSKRWEKARIKVARLHYGGSWITRLTGMGYW